MSGLRRGLLIPTVFVAIGLACLIALGVWQLERKSWKETLVATMKQRLNAEPRLLPEASEWHGLNRADHEFIRVYFRGAFLPERRDGPPREARLYTGASALREDVKTPGYFVFAPARLPNGQIVVVNRGYVANPRPTAATPPVPFPPVPLDVTGVIRFPDRSGWFDQSYSAADDLWFVRDPAAMAARNGWGSVAPFYIDMEAPAPPDGVPRPGRTTINLRNDHLQYAITWFSVAGVLVVMFVLWVRRRGDRPAGL